MKQNILIKLIIGLFPLLTIGQIEKDTIRLFYLGGQSNMDGYGYNSDLPENLNQEFKNVWIFHGNPAPDENPNGGTGEWSNLKPGHGVGFSGYKSKINYQIVLE